MYLHKLLITYALLFASMVFLSACSSHKSPVEPSTNGYSGAINDLPEVSSQVSAKHRVLAVYDAVIDPDAGTFTVEPSERTADYHFPLTQLFPNVLKVTGYGFTPNFWADIKLIHPFPGSGIDGFDPRVIAILPANDGVRFVYPAFGIAGNNAVVLEPDGYTTLFDNLGGSIIGGVNPFKAYFKSVQNRRWSSTGVTEETQKWQMNLAGFGGPMVFKLVVDISTNYPNPPTPFTDNAIEPVDISVEVSSALTSTGDGSALVTAYVTRWNSPDHNLGSVIISAPALQNNVEPCEYQSLVEMPLEYRGTLHNINHAPEGEYYALIAAPSNDHNTCMYKEFTLTVHPASSGDLIWAKTAGGNGGDISYSISQLSDDDSVVITGSYIGTSTFGTGEVNQTILTSSGGKDIFIAKYNSDGTLAWVKSAGGSNDDEGLGINCNFGQIYVTGYFNGTATFGKGEANQTVLVSSGNKDIFIAHYDIDGALLWVKHAEGTGTDESKAIISFFGGSSAITGYFMSSDITFGAGERNETTLHLSGNSDIFIAKYYYSGQLEWAKKAGGAAYDEGSAIDAFFTYDLSFVCTGYYGPISTWGSGEPNEISYDTAGAFDTFFAKYNEDGTVVWVKRAGGVAGDYGKGIAELSDGTITATGYFANSSVFGFGESNQTILTSAGDNDVYIAHLNSDGTLAWAKQAGGTGRDESFGITTLSDDDTVITGHFMSTTTFGVGETYQTILASAGGFDAFYARYNTDGTLRWAKRAGGTYWDWSYSVTAMENDYTAATGYYTNTATFGPGESNETILSAIGASDIFVAKLKP